MNMIKRQIERIIRFFRILVFATYSLQFVELGRKYFVMSKKRVPLSPEGDYLETTSFSVGEI